MIHKKSLHHVTELTAPRKQNRWAIRKLNEDRLKASFPPLTWDQEEAGAEAGAEAAVRKLVKTETNA